MRSNICPKAGGDEAGTTQISVGRNPDKGKANAKVPRPLWPKGMGGWGGAGDAGVNRGGGVAEQGLSGFGSSFENMEGL